MNRSYYIQIESIRSGQIRAYGPYVMEARLTFTMDKFPDYNKIVPYTAVGKQKLRRVIDAHVGYPCYLPEEPHDWAAWIIHKLVQEDANVWFVRVEQPYLD